MLANLLLSMLCLHEILVVSITVVLGNVIEYLVYFELCFEFLVCDWCSGLLLCMCVYFLWDGDSVLV